MPTFRETPDSPITTSKTTLKDADAEFLILLKAFDDTFSQIVHSRTSYRYEDIIQKAKFKPVYEPDQNGVLTLDLAALGNYE